MRLPRGAVLGLAQAENLGQLHDSAKFSGALVNTQSVTREDSFSNGVGSRFGLTLCCRRIPVGAFVMLTIAQAVFAQAVFAQATIAC